MDRAGRPLRPGEPPIWKRFVEAELVGSADRVLDVGCGTGGPTRDVARVATDGEVTGIDLSTRMLELARGGARTRGSTT